MPFDLRIKNFQDPKEAFESFKSLNQHISNDNHQLLIIDNDMPHYNGSVLIDKVFFLLRS